MKVSEMIKNLQEFMNEHGDLDCWYVVDDEGNNIMKFIMSQVSIMLTKMVMSVEILKMWNIVI